MRASAEPALRKGRTVLAETDRQSQKQTERKMRLFNRTID